MTTTTTNYNFVKAEASEAYSLTVVNDNLDDIDAAIAAKLAKVTTGDKIQLYGVNASNAQAMYDMDTDLSSVSANDDTIPSAKATKTALDLKETLLATVSRLSDNVTLANSDCGKIYLPHASSAYTLNIPKDTLSTGWWCGIVNDTGGDVNVDPAADVTLNGGTATITIDADNEIAFLICTAANTFEIRGNI